MPQNKGSHIPCVQLNMHRAPSANTERLNLLNELPAALCLLQEPYTIRERLPCPRGFDVFPSSTARLRFAIFFFFFFISGVPQRLDAGD